MICGEHRHAVSRGSLGGAANVCRDVGRAASRGKLEKHKVNPTDKPQKPYPQPVQNTELANTVLRAYIEVRVWPTSRRENYDILFFELRSSSSIAR